MIAFLSQTLARSSIHSHLLLHSLEKRITEIVCLPRSTRQLFLSWTSGVIIKFSRFSPYSVKVGTMDFIRGFISPRILIALYLTVNRIVLSLDPRRMISPANRHSRLPPPLVSFVSIHNGAQLCLSTSFLCVIKCIPHSSGLLVRSGLCGRDSR